VRDIQQEGAIAAQKVPHVRPSPNIILEGELTEREKEAFGTCCAAHFYVIDRFPMFLCGNLDTPGKKSSSIQPHLFGYDINILSVEKGSRCLSEWET
jgi:hypothetical protein